MEVQCCYLFMSFFNGSMYYYITTTNVRGEQTIANKIGPSLLFLNKT